MSLQFCQRNRPLAVLMTSVTVSLGTLATLQAQQNGFRESPPAESSQSTPEQETLDELVREAIALANQGRYEAAIKEIEALRKTHPDDQRLSMFLVRLFNARILQLLESNNRTEADKFVTRSANLAREIVARTDPGQLSDVKSFLSATIYNEACSLALAGKSDQALSRLEEAFEWGYDDFDNAKTDADLASLAGTPAFAELIDTRKRLLVQRLKTETAEQLANFESWNFNFELPTLDQSMVALTDFKGKVLIVNFWGTWCPRCRAEIPFLIKLKQQHGSRELDVVGLNYERGASEEDDIENVQSVIDELQINYQCLIGTPDVMDQIPEFRDFPTTLFIDRSGNVRLQLTGLQSFEKLESVCLALLSETPDRDD